MTTVSIDPFETPVADADLPPELDCANLADVLEYLRPRLVPALVDEAGFQSIAYVAAQVPTLLSTFWGLEIRLGEVARRADILWEVRQEGPGARLLAGDAPTGLARDQVEGLVSASPHWQALRRFSHRWRDDDKGTPAISNIWMEVDTASVTETAELDALVRRPCLFWGANPRQPGSDRLAVKALPGLAQSLFGLTVDEAQLTAVSEALPEGADVFQLGVMAARGGTLVRLCLRGMNPEQTATWLTQINWPGDTQAVIDTMYRLRPLTGQIALNVDLYPGETGPKLGLELYRPGEGIEVDQWRPLFQTLLDDGLAREDKIEGLIGFPAQQRFRQAEALLRDPPSGFPVLVQSLHHIKVVLVEDKLVEAKAYLGVYRPGMDYSAFVGGQEATDRGGWIIT